MIYELLANYGMDRSVRITQLGNAGGFSGACITLVEAEVGKCCLRQWPHSHPTQQRLDWIHRNLLHAGVNGCPVPVPIRTCHGDTFVRFRDRFWELSPWMPGSADYETTPNLPRLLNAIQKLAEFHRSTAQVQLEFGPSANVKSRVEQLASSQTLMTSIEDAALNHTFPPIVRLYNELHRCREWFPHCLQELSQTIDRPLVLQPVIRDIWHDHILFTGNEVSGIVDFGAMQLDHVSLDLARLLGSLVGDPDDPDWLAALEHYCSYRPLLNYEIEVIRLLDQSAVLLSSLNWLRWIVLEKREYEDWQAVQRRIDILGQRLVRLSGQATG
ncbi:MAG: phosphotransferase [Mariniblastus sp.]|nr:phosphotransferase [Mariniblastus sp.]